MITSMNLIRRKKDDEEVVGELKYGTLITGIHGHPDCVYIKVKKKPCVGINLNWPSGHSVLMNIKSGSLRAIDGSAIVNVLEGSLSLGKGIAENFLKN